MPEPPKLELLTRPAGAPGFHLHELQRSQVHQQFRPCRLSEDAWQVTPQPHSLDGTRTYILKNLRQDRFLLLNAREYFLWQYFDGAHSMEEVARAFHFEFGAFDYDIIRALIVKLFQAGLLVEPDQLDLQRRRNDKTGNRWARSRRSLTAFWRRLSFTVPHADRICSTLYRHGGFLLFHWLTLGLVVILALIAGGVAIGMSGQAKQFTALLGAQPWRSTLIMLAALLTASMFHVLVHALACKAYYRQVRGLGFFLLQGVLPTFYADVTDIFMSTRHARVVVDVSGPMVELVLGSVAFLIAYQAPPGAGQAVWFGTGVLLWEGALINLYPFSFLELDGYNIVADLLAMPTLRQQALALAPTLPRRLLKPANIRRAEWLQIGYLLLCTLSVLIYLIAHLDALRKLLPSWN